MRQQRRAQLVGANVKTRVLRFNAAGVQRGVLHLRRERMRDRIAKKPKANRRMDVARDVAPMFEIGECVTLGSLLIFFHATA